MAYRSGPRILRLDPVDVDVLRRGVADQPRCGGGSWLCLTRLTRLTRLSPPVSNAPTFCSGVAQLIERQRRAGSEAEDALELLPNTTRTAETYRAA